MFVRLVKKKNDHVSVRIVENKRVNGKVKQKTVCCVGHFHKDEHEGIEARKRVAENMIISMKNEDNPAFFGFEHIHAPKKRKTQKKETEQTPDASKIPRAEEPKVPKGFVNADTLKEEHRIHRGVGDIFGHAYEQLNLSDSIETGYKKDQSNEILKEAVLARISAPTSKRQSVENIEKEKNIKLDLDQVYRMMDKVFDNESRIKEKICQSTLNLFKQKIDVAFFDVTTLYFESFTPDELRSSGFSKDNKFKETQVMLALITTTNGLPIGYELFPGNTYEGSTLIAAVEKVEKTYDISNAFLVADRGMFTKENLNHLDKKKIKFIVAAKLKSTKKNLKNQICDDVEQALKRNEELKFWSKDYEYNKWRLIVNYCQKRANKDSKDTQRLVERIKSKMKDGKVRLSDLINNTGTKKFLKIDKNEAKEATLNTEKIEQQARWYGIHGVITNHSSEEMNSNEILARYKNLWQIEAAFRVNKHDLRMRPIYHWTPKRIKAHVLICYMAYALVAVVKYNLKEKGINLSVGKIRQELKDLQETLILDTDTKKRFILPPKINETQRAIYKTLGIELVEKTRFVEN